MNAEKHYNKLLEKEAPVVRYYGMRRLGALYLLKGKFEKSKNLAAQGIELAERIE